MFLRWSVTWKMINLETPAFHSAIKKYILCKQPLRNPSNQTQVNVKPAKLYRTSLRPNSQFVDFENKQLYTSLSCQSMPGLMLRWRCHYLDQSRTFLLCIWWALNLDYPQRNYHSSLMNSQSILALFLFNAIMQISIRPKLNKQSIMKPVKAIQNKLNL